MSPLGLGSDLSISTRGPAAHTGIVGLKATHGRVPATGHWPQVPRRFWHIGPMARSVRDVALAYSLIAGPDGADGFSTLAPGVDAGVRATSKRPLRVGWLARPGFFGPIDPEVVATVKDAAKALTAVGCQVEEVNLPILKETDAVSLLWRLQQMETRPAFEKVTAGHRTRSSVMSKRSMERQTHRSRILSLPSRRWNSFATASPRISGATMCCSAR